jgi:hypothetical protein
LREQHNAIQHPGSLHSEANAALDRTRDIAPKLAFCRILAADLILQLPNAGLIPKICS